MYERVIIFGCGGVGSHLAYFLSKYKNEYKDDIREIVLVDFDIVEEKNLNRQMFFKDSVGEYKCEYLAKLLDGINGIKFRALRVKVSDNSVLSIFDSEKDFAFICVDVQDYKNMIGKYFKNFLVCGCEKDVFEIRNYLNKSDENVFQFVFNGGYFSTQVFSSNLLCAFYMFKIFFEKCNYVNENKIKVKIDLSVLFGGI